MLPRHLRRKCAVLLPVVLCFVFGFYLLASVDPTAAPAAGNDFAATVESYESEHVLCIVVPFRDRFEELQVFAPYMHKYLKMKRINHVILIINQVDDLRFNRASLINVGYFESLTTGCDYMAMHDVDLLPLNGQLDYTFPAQGPFHVASPEYHPKYHYEKFIGGIVLLTLAQYRQVNGMSNKYWGWGMEDDEFYLRLRDAQLVIRRPHNLTTSRDDTFRHVHDGRQRPRDMNRFFNQKEMSRRRDREGGLDTVLYTVASRVPVTIAGAQITVVNVRLHCDFNWTPYCRFPPPEQGQKSEQQKRDRR